MELLPVDAETRAHRRDRRESERIELKLKERNRVNLLAERLI
jgi:hypothetical protein